MSLIAIKHSHFFCSFTLNLRYTWQKFVPTVTGSSSHYRYNTVYHQHIWLAVPCCHRLYVSVCCGILLRVCVCWKRCKVNDNGIESRLDGAKWTWRKYTDIESKIQCCFCCLGVQQRNVHSHSGVVASGFSSLLDSLPTQWKLIFSRTKQKSFGIPELVVCVFVFVQTILCSLADFPLKKRNTRA